MGRKIPPSMKDWNAEKLFPGRIGLNPVLVGSFSTCPVYNDGQYCGYFTQAVDGTGAAQLSHDAGGSFDCPRRRWHPVMESFFSQTLHVARCSVSSGRWEFKGTSQHDPAFPTVGLLWFLPFVGKQSLRLDISFSMVGFSYFINTQIAAGLWFFHLFSKVQRAPIDSGF